MKKEKCKVNFKRLSAFTLSFFVLFSSIFFLVAPVSASSIPNSSRVGYFSINEDVILSVGTGVNVPVYGFNAVIPLGAVYRIQIYDDDGYRYVVVNQERTIYRSDYGFLDPSFQYFYFELFNLSYDEQVSFDVFFQPVSELAFDFNRIDYFQFEAAFPIDDFFNPLITKPLTFEIDAYVGSSRLSAMSVSSVITPYLFFTLDGVSQVVISDSGQWSNESYRILRDFSELTPATLMFLYAHGDFFLTPPPSFLDRLGSGFTAAIGWLGDFFTFLFTGNLALAFVLVSVGFGLTLLSFGWRWIRRWLWGY